MAGSSTKGNYYKIKTKKYFEDLGYHVEYLEKLQRIFTKGKVIHIKRDLLASDGLAMKDNQLIFWQCKLNKKNIAAAVKEFHKLPFPPFVDLWIVVWTPRIKEPEIIEVDIHEEQE